jgi:hypothetical protein
MNKLWCLLFFLALGGLTHAQVFGIDDSLKKIPRSKERSLEELCRYISENSSSDLEKARGAYYWIANNIRYDAKKFFKDKPSNSRPGDVFSKRKAVCEGYANLFGEMCSMMNIECVVVVGYSKGYGYKPGQALTIADHAWNAVRVDSTWRLVDATWASGDIHKRLFRKFVPKFYDEYFNVPPKEMALTHLPELPMWQLLEDPVPVKLFSGDEKKLHWHLNNPGTVKYSYRDTIRMMHPDTAKYTMKYGAMALRFNAQNTVPLALAGLSLMSNLEYKSQFRSNGQGAGKGEIDSMIQMAARALALLKIVKSPRQSVMDGVKDLMEWTNAKLSQMHLERAKLHLDEGRSDTISSLDSLAIRLRPVLESLDKAIKCSIESNSKLLHRAVCARAYEHYIAAYSQYAARQQREQEKEKKQKITKEIASFVQQVKKAVPPSCSCYEEIKKWQ